MLGLKFLFRKQNPWIPLIAGLLCLLLGLLMFYLAPVHALFYWVGILIALVGAFMIGVILG